MLPGLLGSLDAPESAGQGTADEQWDSDAPDVDERSVDERSAEG